MTARVVIAPEQAGQRLDQVAAQAFSLSVRAAKHALAQGHIRLDDRPAKKGDLAKPGQTLTYVAPAWFVPEGPVPTILVETADLLVVNKPAGCPCHPAQPGEGGTVLDRLGAAFPEVLADLGGQPYEGGLCHRLDVATSGALLVARQAAAWAAARAAFSAHAVHKSYLALCQGAPDRAVIEAPLAQRGDHVVVDETGLFARTVVDDVRALDQGRTLVWVSTTTGRRHQVRAHLAVSGAPLVGDGLYGGPADAPRFMLHAVGLGVPGLPPVHAPLEDDQRSLLADLGIEPPALDLSRGG